MKRTVGILFVTGLALAASSAFARSIKQPESRTVLKERWQVYLCGSLKPADRPAPVGGPRYNVLYDGRHVIIQKAILNPSVRNSIFQRTRFLGNFETDNEDLAVYRSTDAEQTLQVVVAFVRDGREEGRPVSRMWINRTENTDFEADCK